jgi:hypothetical protein
MVNEKQNQMAFVAIVAIVAIVGLFLMFTNNGSPTTVTEETASEDMAGQAIRADKDTWTLEYWDDEKDSQEAGSENAGIETGTNYDEQNPCAGLSGAAQGECWAEWILDQINSANKDSDSYAAFKEFLEDEGMSIYIGEEEIGKWVVDDPSGHVIWEEEEE